ncbi:ATP-binding protein [Vibrio sonorensis]|uniref:ATP-binding protein n=1 Tax=Vibrio sonorensis TaxID=1004316 RepID=UPI000AB0D4DC
MINHELRTPLNGLLGSAELLGDSGLSESQMEMLNNMTQSGELLRHIINDLLDFSKINAGMLELTPRQFSKNALRETIEGIFKPKAAEKRLAFNIEVSSKLPEQLIGDFDRICQILVNVVGNAIKYTLEGSVTLEIDWKDEKMICQVTDTGIGIPESARETLFNPFVQADRTTKRMFEGTGLGLSICSKLLELMNGHIEFESEVGEGTTFTCFVPLKLGKQDVQAGRKKGKTYSESELQSLSVLVVDDIKMNQVIIHQMLKKMSITPDFANNGLEAVKLAQSKPYDVVFMDCRMPEMDGFEATDYLRKQGYESPIVALTAGTTLEERERCIQSGMNDILTKPYTAADLIVTMEKWCKKLNLG